MSANFETCGVIGRCLGIRQRVVGIDVRGAPDAFPVLHGTARGTQGRIGVEASRSPVAVMVVAGHDHGRLQVPRQIPEARQRLLAEVHLDDEVGQETLLLVSLGDRHLVQIDPVWDRTRCIENRSSERMRSRPSPALPMPDFPVGYRRQTGPDHR